MSESNILIRNIDAFRLMSSLADESIDFIFTDPPYAVSRTSGLNEGGVERFQISIDFGEWDHIEIDLDHFAKECYRVLKVHGTALIFYDLWKISYLKQSFEDHKFVQARFIEWLKTNPVPRNSKVNYLTNAREVALSFTKVSKPTFNSYYNRGIYQLPIPRENRFHPNQKPIKLINKLMRIHSKPGDEVLDPYSGSGTIAVSALLNGRNCLASELDPNYHDLSVRRLAKEYERLNRPNV